MGNYGHDRLTEILFSTVAIGLAIFVANILCAAMLRIYFHLRFRLRRDRSEP